jgi:hypothetical protein
LKLKDTAKCFSLRGKVKSKEDYEIQKISKKSDFLPIVMGGKNINEGLFTVMITTPKALIR